MKSSQEELFVKTEANAWFERNSKKIIEPASKDHHIIQAMMATNINISGKFIDLGGGVGQVSAGLTKLYPNLQGTVLEPSSKAVEAGKKEFPWLSFICGSIAKKNDMPSEIYDIIIVAGVLTLIDRSILGQAVANIDSLLKQGGHLILSDFYTPFPRANKYHHNSEILTYKQDYTLPFKALNIYTEIYCDSKSNDELDSFDNDDIYDTWWMTSVLRKDLLGRYRRG